MGLFRREVQAGVAMAEATRPAREEPVVEYDSLDEALMETFPASDPIAVDRVRPVAKEAASADRR